MTMGIVRVASMAARIAGTATVRMTLTLNATSSAARRGSRLASPLRPSASIRRLDLPRNPARPGHAGRHRAAPACEDRKRWPARKPIRTTFFAWAQAATGAARRAPATAPRNTRRSMVGAPIRTRSRDGGQSTTAIASTSTIKSGWASLRTSTVVLVGSSGRRSPSVRRRA